MYLGRVIRFGFLAAAVAFAGASSFSQAGDADATVHAEIARALNKKQFSGVQVSVSGGVALLTGVVPTYADKLDAARRARGRKGVTDVTNRIEVAPGEIDDATLERKLIDKVSNDRVGYGTTAFNAITVRVQNGAVTLGGVAYSPIDRNSAVSQVEYTPGVRDVVDHITVAPPSPNDDRIRRAEFQAIYGYPSMTKYAINPVKPIRIVVVNGKVTLVGVVDNQVDKDLVNLRANTVSGVFKVTNDLQVAGRSGASADR